MYASINPISSEFNFLSQNAPAYPGPRIGIPSGSNIVKSADFAPPPRDIAVKPTERTMKFLRFIGTTVSLILISVPLAHAAANLTISSASLATDGQTVSLTMSAGSLLPTSGLTGCFTWHSSVANPGTAGAATTSGSTVTFSLSAPMDRASTLTIDIATVGGGCSLTSSGNTPQGQSGVAVTNNSEWYGCAGSQLSTYARYHGGAVVSGDPQGIGYANACWWSGSLGAVDVNATGSAVKVWALNYDNAFCLYQDGAAVGSRVKLSSSVVFSEATLATGLTGTHEYWIIPCSGVASEHWAGTVIVPLIRFVGGAPTGAKPASRYLFVMYGDSAVGSGGGLDNSSLTDSGQLVISSGYSAQIDPQSGQSVSTYLRDHAAAGTIPYAANSPDLVILEGGSNDDQTSVTIGNNTTPGMFQGDYVTMVRNVQTNAHPPTKLLARGILPYTGSNSGNIASYVAAQAAAVAYVNTTYGTNVCFYHTTGWITPPTDTSDGVHPNVTGYLKMANRQIPVLGGYRDGASFTVSGPSSGVNGTPSSNFTVTLPYSATWAGESVTMTSSDSGAVLTPSVGSPGTGSVVVTPTSSASTYTFTITPSTTGAITITFSGMPDCWIAPTPASYTSTGGGGGALSLRLNGSQTATNNSVAAQSQNGACRWEGQITFTSSPTTGTAGSVNACGFSMVYNTGNILFSSNANWSCCYNIPLSSFSSNWLDFRFQQVPSGAGGYLAFEVWDISGNRVISHIEPYTSTANTRMNGASAGATGSQNTTWGFFRVYTTNVPMGSREPAFADTSTFLDWKFNGTLMDSSGNIYNATSSGGTPAASCGSAPCYEASTGQNLVTSVIKTNPAPFWSNWQSWKAGATNGLDCTASVDMSESTAAPTCSWSQLSGPTTLSFSSTSSTQPTVTNTVFGNYGIQLVTTGTSGMATSTQNIGAVAFDANGVVSNGDANVAKLFGSQIAFGQNPWAWEDERNLYAITAQITYQAAQNDFGWAVTGQGTVGYPFAGRGIAPGQAGTTLCGTTSCNGTTLSSSGLTFSVTDASKLPSLVTLPSWFLIGNSSATFEMVRVTSATATTGNSTLTVDYDGRGLAGNQTDIGGYPNVVNAQPWLGNSTITVGEMRVTGTGTLFLTDAQRAICPAGQGPPGTSVYSTGTVALTAASTTATFSGSAWTADTVGADSYGKGFLRVSATHATGTPFIFWAQIVSVNVGLQTMVLSRPAPTGVDATGFAYAITTHAFYPDLEFTSPLGATERLLFNTVGCESETKMFVLPTHDIPALDSTNVTSQKFSYKTNLRAFAASSFDVSNFYGVGIAARNFYYRSGYGPALTLANSIDEYWPRDPQIGGCYAGGQPLELGGGIIGGFIDKVLNGSTVLSWENLEQCAVIGEIGASACNAHDARDGGYLAAFTTLYANYGTNRASYTSPLQAILARDQGCKRSSGDGYSGAAVNSFSNSAVWSPSNVGRTSALVLTNGSAAVTGSGFTAGNVAAGTGYCYGKDIITLNVTPGSNAATVASGTISSMTYVAGDLLYIADTSTSPTTTRVIEFSGTGTIGAAVTLAQLWPGAGSGPYAAMSASGLLNSTPSGTFGYGGIFAAASSTGPPPDWPTITQAAAHTNNEALRQVWACKFIDSTHLILNRTWDGTSTSGLTPGLAYYISYYTIGSFGQQSFMIGGPKTNQMNWASQNADATISAGYMTILPLVGEWYNAYGWDSLNANHGTFYNVVAEACGGPTDVPAGSFGSMHGWQGCGSNGLAAGSATVARVNSAEGGAAMIQYFLANPTPARRAAVDTFYGAIFGYKPYCDSSILSTCDGTVASQLDDLSLSIFKWTGFYDGMGGFFTNSWPAVRASLQAGGSRRVGEFRSYGGSRHK